MLAEPSSRCRTGSRRACARARLALDLVHQGSHRSVDGPSVSSMRRAPCSRAIPPPAGPRRERADPVRRPAHVVQRPSWSGSRSPRRERARVLGRRSPRLVGPTRREDQEPTVVPSTRRAGTTSPPPRGTTSRRTDRSCPPSGARPDRRTDSRDRSSTVEVALRQEPIPPGGPVRTSIPRVSLRYLPMNPVW